MTKKYSWVVEKCLRPWAYYHGNIAQFAFRKLLIFELCLSSHHHRSWAQRQQWHNWPALLFGLISWCAWPLWHSGPGLSFFLGWFLYSSLSWIVQTDAMYFHFCFQAVECLLECVAVSLCLNTICCYPFNIFYDCAVTSFTQLFPDASAMFWPFWAFGQAHRLPDLERGVKDTFPSQHFCTKCSLCQICTGGCYVPPDTLAEAGYVTL